MVVTVCGLIVSMVLTIGIAYPLSRKELAGRKVLNFIVILPMLLSPWISSKIFAGKRSGTDGFPYGSDFSGCNEHL